MLATAVDDLVGKPLCVSSGTSLRLRTTRCHLFPANMPHWHIRASYIPMRENRGIHLCLTILRFESIGKIGALRRCASIPPPTGFYGESKDLSSQSIIVFAHNIFIEPLDDCRHAKTTKTSTKRPTQKSSKKKAGTKSIPAKSFPFSHKPISISVTRMTSWIFARVVLINSAAIN